MIEYHKTTLELKRGSLNSKGEFTAYASTFGNIDTDLDVIDIGAFKSAIDLHKNNNTMPALLWSHDQNEPIGRWLTMREDQHGLLMTGKLTLGTKRGAEAYALLEDEAISFSIGFIAAPNGVAFMDGIRHIRKIQRLGEVSLVAIPANTMAKLVALKSESSNKRNAEKVLRDAGLSRKQAKLVVAGKWGSLVRDGQGLESLNRVATAIESLTTTIQQTR